MKRKNGWQLAEEADEPEPKNWPRFIARAKRDADAVRDAVEVNGAASLPPIGED